MDKQKYSDAIDWLDSQFAYFVTHVLNIGRPIDSGLIPTACVMKMKDDKSENFAFAFNPEFAATLTVEDYAFILSHETMHIVLNHLSLCQRFKDKIRFNIAADCVINDYLVGAGLRASDDLMDNLMSGQKNVGYNCAHVTVGQVYDDLPDDIVEQLGIGQQLDDHDWIHIPDKFLPQEVRDALDKLARGAPIPKDLQKIKNDIDDKSDIKNMYAGTGQTEERAFMDTFGVKMDWINLMKKLNPDMFKMKDGKRMKPSYHARPRKLGAFPNLIMPVKTKSKKMGFGDKPVIAMALDTSGSIGDETARRFITLARSIPRTEIHLEVCTFTDRIKLLDLDNPKYSSGGTAFSPIEQWIRDTVMPKYRNKYPKSVVVITDGCAAFHGVKPDEKNKEKWLWLMEGSYWNTSHLFGEIAKLADFIK